MNKLCRFLALLFFCNTAFANLPYFPITFPRDEGAHFKNVSYQFNQLMEWWYFNGKITTTEGRHFGYDIAFFNPAVTRNSVITLPMLHIQVADLDNKKSQGTVMRYAPNTGNVSVEKLDIVISDDYSLRKEWRDGKEIYFLKAEGHEGETTIKFELMLEPSSEPMLINETGLMSMPDNTNSYYYSIPHFKTSGHFTINESDYQIQKNSGDTWMDHQWGDFDVRKNGWEWFSVRLENGLDANIFLNIEYKTNTVKSGLANIRLPSGEMRFIPYKEFSVSRSNYWFDPKLSISYPMTFNFEFPQLNLKIENIAAFPEQEKNGYWEGYSDAHAIYDAKPVEGFSYMEIVYAKPSLSS